ncbi:hypothetical protein CPB84DRAFT_1842208 [Gymnopilus junonius]|uniref:Uncharacterized protein n=1 Tax=Gymnopilus junonius TaxID=109634 RepID=A0A9P5NYG7_GYMJU|nr:hypothetical protein CPB84DRAFT_1842208 [Gymnopilus junonius]
MSSKGKGLTPSQVLLRRSLQMFNVRRNQQRGYDAFPKLSASPGQNSAPPAAYWSRNAELAEAASGAVPSFSSYLASFIFSSPQIKPQEKMGYFQTLLDSPLKANYVAQMNNKSNIEYANYGFTNLTVDESFSQENEWQPTATLLSPFHFPKYGMPKKHNIMDIQEEHQHVESNSSNGAPAIEQPTHIAGFHNVSSLHIPSNSLGLITPIPHVQAKTPYEVSNLSTSARFHGLSSSLLGGHATFFESLHDQQHDDTFTIATGDPFMFPSYSSGFSNSEPTEKFEGMSYPEETNIGPPPHPFLLPSLGPWERKNYAITDFSLISDGGEEHPQNIISDKGAHSDVSVGVPVEPDEATGSQSRREPTGEQASSIVEHPIKRKTIYGRPKKNECVKIRDPGRK